jgi:predicted metalloprotease with PDZ domain
MLSTSAFISNYVIKIIACYLLSIIHKVNFSMTSPNQTKSVALSEVAVKYELTVINTSQHLFEIKMHVDLSVLTKQSIKSLSVAMPAWIPGSYMIRDFSRNLHGLSSPQGKLKITQQSKQDWLIEHQDQTSLENFSLHYQVYANDLSVRSAFINDEYAFCNGTSVFLCIKNHEFVVHEVVISQVHDLLLPNIVTSLPRSNNTSTSFVAQDYFELIDHPFLLGKFEDYCFDVLGHRFHLVFTGEHDFDLPRMERDLSPVIEHHIALFGEFPCDEYWFITLVCENGFGGLEHLASTVLQYSRFDLPRVGDGEQLNKEYQQFLSLCSHELFHTWHVKRIKPKIMFEPNLYAEVYTQQLWIYEGFTSFYDDLSLARAQVISPVQYVQILNESITRLVRNPGRLKQSAGESSFDAWTKFYKQDAGSVNHIVSYYNKGAIIALCLDITLRQQSNNKVCLDDVMRSLWKLYGTRQKGTSDQVIVELCQSEFGIDVGSFLYVATQTPIDLPIPTLLQSIGLKMKMRASHHFQDKGGPSTGQASFDIGGVLTMTDKLLKVTSVQDYRALSECGVLVGDTIVALNKWQCDEKRFLQILQHSKIGALMPLDVIRDGRLLTLNFRVHEAIVDTCDIAIENSSLYYDWLRIKKPD